MSGLYSSLNTTTMALSAHSRAIETAGKNLANVNNASYARQRVVYGDRGTVITPQGAESLGLEALSIQQIRDTLLDRQLMRETGLLGMYEAAQQSLQRAQAGLGQTIDGSADVGGASSSSTGGISAALDNFFNAFQALASRPTDIGVRQNLVQTASILVDRFRETDTRLAQVQTDIDAEIGGDVDDVNRLLGTIADLNGQIARFEVNNPGSAVDLRDQRQARLEELAKLLPVEVRDLSDGGVQVVIKDASNADVLLVDDRTVTGPVTFTGTGLTGGASAASLALSSGAIHGALDARDGAVQDLRDQLDTLAQQLVNSVNQAYNPGGTVGADFFDPAGLTAGTIAVQSGLTASGIVAGTGGAGDNTVAAAIASLATRSFSIAGGDLIDGTLGGAYTRAVSGLGQSLAAANARVDDQGSIERLVRNQRDSISGVSLDEEMADLVKFQRAFQASSRVFSVIDNLLDVVVNQLGRA